MLLGYGKAEVLQDLNSDLISGNESSPGPENNPKESSWLHPRNVALDARTVRDCLVPGLSEAWPVPMPTKEKTQAAGLRPWPCVGAMCPWQLEFCSQICLEWQVTFSASQQAFSCERWQLHELLSKICLRYRGQRRTQGYSIWYHLGPSGSWSPL